MDESSFPGASCPNDEEAGFAFSSAPFVSFSDDLQTLQGSVEMVGDDMGQPGELDLFGNTRPLLRLHQLKAQVEIQLWSTWTLL